MDKLKKLDQKCNELDRKLDRMRGTDKEGGTEYMTILYKLQQLTRERLGGIKHT